MIHSQTLPPIGPENLVSIRERLAAVFTLLKGANLLITGGTGFVGRWLVESFIELEKFYKSGCQLTLLSRDPGAFLNLLPHLKHEKRIDFIKGDVRNFRFPEKRYTHMIHGATTPDPSLIAGEPLTMYDTIVSGTKNLLDYARDRRDCRILNISTIKIYGCEQFNPLNVEDGLHLAPDPYDKYAAYLEGKRVAEFLCATYSDQYGIKIPVARLSHQLGAHIPLNTGNAAGDFISSVLQARPLVLKSDGSSFRSYMYTGDLVVWLYTLLLKGESEPYNVGSQAGYSLHEIAHMIAGQYGLPVEYLQAESKQVRPKGLIPSTRKAQEKFGLTCEVEFMEAVDKTVCWYRNACAR